MKVFTVTLIFAILASCYGYSYIIPASIKNAGICYFNGHVLSRGNNQMPTACQNMKCNEDGSILVQGCGRLGLQGCTLLEQENLDKPYPDCCEMTYRCKDDDGNTITKQWNQLTMVGGSVSNAEKTEQSVTENKADQADLNDKDSEDV